jgi:hypothetical protein
MPPLGLLEHKTHQHRNRRILATTRSVSPTWHSHIVKHDQPILDSRRTTAASRTTLPSSLAFQNRVLLLGIRAAAQPLCL